MRYDNIDALDQRIERIISGTVKHYYTDWKNYDRPKYMGLKGSKQPGDRVMFLIARAYGTYLITLDQIANTTAGATIYEHFIANEHADYYRIDLDRLSVDKIDPEKYLIRIGLAH